MKNILDIDGNSIEHLDKAGHFFHVFCRGLVLWGADDSGMLQNVYTFEAARAAKDNQVDDLRGMHGTFGGIAGARSRPGDEERDGNGQRPEARSPVARPIGHVPPGGRPVPTGRPPPDGMPILTRERQLTLLFWRIAQAHRQYLMRLAMRWMNGNSADAEDALSEALIRARARFVESEGAVANPKAWLARVLHNYCVDLHRRAASRAQYAETVKVEDPATIRTEAPRSPEDQVLDAELEREVRAAVAALPDPLRRVFSQRVLQGRPYDAIARDLRVTNENARKRVQQARALLRARLDADAGRSPARRN